MIKRILFCFLFFIFIKFILLITAGSFDLILNKGLQLDNGPSIKSTLGYPIGVILIGLIAKWKFRYAFEQCLNWMRFSWRNLVYLMSSLVVIIILFSIIITLAKESGFVKPLVHRNNDLTFLGLLSLLYVMFIIGSTEEIINRGIIAAYCINKIGLIGSMFIVSILFSLGHFYYIGVLPFLSAFIMSILSIILIFKTGSLYASIGLHMGWNFSYSYFENLYNLNNTAIPFWGNLFELYQIGVLCLILVIVLIFRSHIVLKIFQSISTFSKKEPRPKLSSNF